MESLSSFRLSLYTFVACGTWLYIDMFTHIHKYLLCVNSTFHMTPPWRFSLSPLLTLLVPLDSSQSSSCHRYMILWIYIKSRKHKWEKIDRILSFWDWVNLHNVIIFSRILQMTDFHSLWLKKTPCCMYPKFPLCPLDGTPGWLHNLAVVHRATMWAWPRLCLKFVVWDCFHNFFPFFLFVLSQTILKK